MSTPAQAKKLDALIKRLAGEYPETPGAGATPAPPEGADPIVHELLYAFMLWEAGPKLAGAALEAIQGEFVDYNEARIGMSDEIAELLPKRYPLAQERCQRLRASLNAVFKREHALSLASLGEMSKRDSRAALDSLEGMTPFVASRVTLLGLGAHTFPVDARLVEVLAEAGACDAEEAADAVASRLERHFRAGQAAPAYLLLECAEARPSKKSKGAGRNASSPASRTKGARASRSRTSAS